MVEETKISEPSADIAPPKPEQLFLTNVESVTANCAPPAADTAPPAVADQHPVKLQRSKRVNWFPDATDSAPPFPLLAQSSKVRSSSTSVVLAEEAVP